MKNRLLCLIISILMSIFIIQGCASNQPIEVKTDPKLIQSNKAQTSLIKLGYLSSPTPATASTTNVRSSDSSTSKSASTQASEADEVGTRVAIRNFQKVQGLQPTGEVTPELLVALTEAENAGRGNDNLHQTVLSPPNAISPISGKGTVTQVVCRTFIGKRFNGSFEQKGGCSTQASKDDIVKHYQKIKQEKEKLMPKEYKIVETPPKS